MAPVTPVLTTNGFLLTCEGERVAARSDEVDDLFVRRPLDVHPISEIIRKTNQ
jgi:hypothetical protein